MISLKRSRNYIIVKDKKELEAAKTCDICGYIIWEDRNVIYIWTKIFGKWVKEKYVIFGKSKDVDDETTGLRAYQSFYAYCGKSEVERMKSVLSPISMWESYEQLHYANIDFMKEKIHQPIFEFDVNSAFTFGTTKLPEDFEPLKEYMTGLFEKKRTAENPITVSKYKNLQNYLVGYFARVKDFVRVRSEIIKESNKNVELRMVEIIKGKGKVFLSNTDSIVTDEAGAEIMENYKGDGLGQFKLATIADKLYYNSPKAYQLGEKVVYSGVKYFERKHTDFFKEQFATQSGSLINGLNFELSLDNGEYHKLCKVEFGEITVTVVNKIGEKLDDFVYRINKGE